MSGSKESSRIKTLYMAITDQTPRQMINQLQLTARLLRRRFDRLPCIARCSIFTAIILFLSVYGSLFYIIIGNQLRSDSFLETSKCPACYGFRACDMMKSDEAWLTGTSKVRLLDYFNVDNVFDGVAKGRTVHIKKLGSDKEIARMEEELCALAREGPDCNAGAAVARALPASGFTWMQAHLAGKTDLTACPTERLMDRIMDRYQEKLDAILLSARERAQLVTTLMINPEPILFQTFPAGEGWPFPAYFGACGRFVVTDWAGGPVPLRDFFSAGWPTRAYLALSVLHIAQRLTDNPTRFSLYWTEVDDRSFVVNVTGDVVVVDGRHLAVVDRWEYEQKKEAGWDKPLHAEFKECRSTGDNCKISVPHEQLCRSHSTSDHNYYMVCRAVLSSYATAKGHNGSHGLLHDIPTNVNELYDLHELVEQCARPNNPLDRARVVTRLIKALTDIVGPNRRIERD